MRRHCTSNSPSVVINSETLNVSAVSSNSRDTDPRSASNASVQSSRVLQLTPQFY